MALGASFSALEVVPLVLIGFEAFENLPHARRDRVDATAISWPICFFVGVAFWNLVGAGLFGFLINPPIALYYMQGLNTTPVHGHTALFGVYGMLRSGSRSWFRALLTASALEGSTAGAAFWCMNIGLALMVGLSLLPIGIAQAWRASRRALVRAFGRVPAAAVDRATPLAAHHRRHRVPRRRRRICVVHERPVVRVEL